MASVNRPNLLFYSRTNNCIELLRMMKQYQIDKEFKIINVDNNKSEVIKKIKVIPTMIIPSINKVIIGEDVNDFVISFSKDVATVTFTVDTNVGDITINWEVNI